MRTAGRPEHIRRQIVQQFPAAIEAAHARVDSPNPSTTQRQATRRTGYMINLAKLALVMEAANIVSEYGLAVTPRVALANPRSENPGAPNWRQPVEAAFANQRGQPLEPLYGRIGPPLSGASSTTMPPTCL